MKIEEEQYYQEKKYKATTMRKLPANYQKLYTQSKRNQLNILKNVQIQKIISNINNRLNSDTSNKIKEGLMALIFLLTTDYSEYFQKISPQFIPRVLQLIETQENSQVVLDSIKYLSKLISFEKVSEECLKLFGQKQIQILFRIIKKKRESWRDDFQDEIFTLFANLAIDSVTMRDLFIQKGTVDVILKIIEENLPSEQIFILQSDRLKSSAYPMLIALGLGNPLPQRHKVEKGVNNVLKGFDYINLFWPIQSVCGAIWLLYHYSDYRDQKNCKYFIHTLLKYTSKEVYQKEKQNMLEGHFNKIFMQMYEYYSEKPQNNVMPILHGLCYSDTQKLSRIQYEMIFRQYTPQMYLQLFRAALQNKKTQIVGAIIEPFKQAFNFLKEDYDFTHMLLALEFIWWVMNPLFLPSFLQRQLQSQKKFKYELLAVLKLNLAILSCLRHNSRREFAYCSTKILKKYKNSSLTKQWTSTLTFE